MATTRTTPARRRHNNVKENIYFEPGKQGRRTGITLKDTGIRDEYGLEPVSGIFSSPEPSPQRNAPAPEILETLNLRKTPHLLPKSQTPRHTNIGGTPLRPSSVKPDSRHSSPTRPLSAQPPDRANRLLDFNRNKSPVRTSIETRSPSPFKPRPGKSAKLQKTRKSIFNFDDSPVKRIEPVRDESAELERTVQEVQDAVDQMVDSAINSVPDDVHEDMPDAAQPDQTEVETVNTPEQHNVRRESSVSAGSPITAGLTASPSMKVTSSNQKRKREQQRPHQAEASLPKSNISPEKKRTRSSNVDTTLLSAPEQTTLDEQTFIEPLEDDYTEQPMEPEMTEMTEHSFTEHSVEHPTQMDHTVADQTVMDPTLAEPTSVDDTMADETTAPDETDIDQTVMSSSRGRRIFPVHREGDDAANEGGEDEDVDSAEEFVPTQESDHEQEQREEPEQPQPQPKKRGRKSGPKQKARKESVPTQSRTVPLRESDSAETEGGSKRPGPKSLVQLRAGTPMEEKDATMTRSGRASIKPLKYWVNESFIWEHGEVNGVVRASEVNEGKPAPKRSRPKRRGGLGAIREDDDEEDEDLLPEAWEDEMGVINGPVRTWDHEIGAGNQDDEVHEDIAFASTSIATRDVQGSAFRYAKVMTMPFFGAGMVEIPPGGYKRTKNSRKMQMIFFVHEGKVTVDVGELKFGMTKGGVWQVPRGNNYAIFNESKRHTAKIFFSQGCEVENGVDEAGPA